jgi:hypothetical protein
VSNVKDEASKEAAEMIAKAKAKAKAAEGPGVSVLHEASPSLFSLDLIRVILITSSSISLS